MTGALRIGTSGWTYKHWRGGFYPHGLPQSRWFTRYAEVFDTAEINATFYRLPSQATVAGWREKAPEGFVFAWKASKYVTHAKRLLDAAPSLERIYAPMLTLGAKLGPCLIQLPPSMKLDLERLTTFLDLLPRERRHTVEFRHPSWYVDPVLEVLASRNVALCVSDHHHAPAPALATADFAYVRLHGPGRPLLRLLRGLGAGELVEGHRRLARRGPGRLRLLRQRHRRRRASGCAQAEGVVRVKGATLLELAFRGPPLLPCPRGRRAARFDASAPREGPKSASHIS